MSLRQYGRAVKTPPEQEPQDADLPPFVTFATGAELLVKLDIDPAATGDSVRYTARTHPEWEYGDKGSGKPRPYIMAGQARTMETGYFLDFHRTHPRTGRGRDKAPRRPKGEPQ